MKIEIIYLEPKRLHPHSNEITIADLANILEAKYHLLEKFTEFYGDKLLAYALTLDFENKGNLPRNQAILNEFIKNKWREYILKGLHKIKTEAATMEQRTAFVQTKAYYQSLSVETRVVIDDEPEV